MDLSVERPYYAWKINFKQTNSALAVIGVMVEHVQWDVLRPDGMERPLMEVVQAFVPKDKKTTDKR